MRRASATASRTKALLVAHVGRVNAARPRGDAAELDELLGRREAARRVFEARGQAQGPAGHGLGDERPHPVELGGRRRPVHVAHDRGPDRAVPDERRVIESGPRLLDRGQEAGDVLPLRGQAVLLLARFTHLRGLFVGQREGRAAALSADDRRHALTDGALRAGIDQQAGIGVVVDVDEARRDREAVGLDHGRSPGAPDPADRPDQAVRYAQVGPEGRPAGTVVDRAAGDDQVEVPALGTALQDEAGTGRGDRGGRRGGSCGGMRVCPSCPPPPHHSQIPASSKPSPAAGPLEVAFAPAF